MNARKPFVVPALAGILPFRLKALKGGTTNGENFLMQFPSERVCAIHVLHCLLLIAYPTGRILLLVKTMQPRRNVKFCSV